MKTAIIYSSKTGNTKKVAEAILKGMPGGTELHAVETAPSPDAFDVIAIGFWVDKGTADAKAAAYMQTIRNKKVMTFFTLGAYPDSDHARTSLAAAESLYGEGCECLGSFGCQGAIDPKLIEWMQTLPPDHPHAPDEARRKRWADALNHPDENDLHQATAWARQTMERIT